MVWIVFCLSNIKLSYFPCCTLWITELLVNCHLLLYFEVMVDYRLVLGCIGTIFINSLCFKFTSYVGKSFNLIQSIKKAWSSTKMQLANKTFSLMKNVQILWRLWRVFVDLINEVTKLVYLQYLYILRRKIKKSAQTARQPQMLKEATQYLRSFIKTLLKNYFYPFSINFKQLILVEQLIR